MQERQKPYVEFIILADRAEVLNGKLYVMGGCWDRIQLPQLVPGALFPTGIAMRVMLPTHFRASSQTIELRLHGPGDPQVTPNRLQFVRNPQPTDPDEGPVPVLIAVSAFASFREPGIHRLEAVLLDGDDESVTFVVEEEPPPHVPAPND